MAIRGVLLDIEGVVIEQGSVIAGAPDAVRRLESDGLAIRYLTNTTTRTRDDIARHLRSLGFPAERHALITPGAAAVRCLKSLGATRVHLAAPAPLAPEFSGFDLVETSPEAVVIGDLHTGFTWARLNRIFEFLLDGAALIALHKNRYCRRDGRLALDAGPFVTALEYAASIPATVVGKPSTSFFESALNSLGLDAPSVVMVGDDIEADIGGALDAGMPAVQVKTGKYSLADEAAGRPHPVARIGSLADLPDWIAGSDTGHR